MDNQGKTTLVSVTLMVCFEKPFWIGICERVVDGKLSVCKVTFGPEPKEYEVFQYIFDNWYGLKFSPSVETVVKQKEKINPKRLQRDLKKQIADIKVGTKSQQALKLQQEDNKTLRKTRTRKQKEDEKERMFVLKQEKRKEKHKGR